MKNKQYSVKYKIISLILLISLTSYFIFTYDFSQIITVDDGRNLFTTSTVRMDSVSKYCKKTQYLITDQQRQSYEQNHKAIETFLKANASLLFPAFKNQQWGDIFRQLQVNGAGTFVYMAPFVIGLVLFVLAIPCILCCCVCPETCPPACCRNKNNPNYSNGQLACPTIFVLVLTPLIIAAAIPLMTNHGPYFQDFNCLASKFVDNFANGNTTSNKLTFFSGLKRIRTQFKDVFSPKINDVQGQIAKLLPSASSIMDNTMTSINNALDQMKAMPKGGTDFNQFTQTYTTPLTQSTNTGTLSTLLGPQIGTFGVPTTLLGNLYEYITQQIYDNMTTITTAATNVHPKLVVGDIGAQITAMDAVLAKVQNNIIDIGDNQFSPAQSFLDQFDSYNIKYSMYFYGLIMGVSVLVLFGVMFLKCFGFIKFRFCLYFLCLIIFLICLVTYLLSIIFSVTLPTLFYTCEYFKSTFSTPTKWTSTIIDLKGTSNTELANHFAQCFGGSNDFITYVNPTLSGYITNLKRSVFNSKQYKFNDMTIQLNAKLLAMRSLIDSAGQGSIPDFDVNSNLGVLQINKFNTIANKSLFTTDCPASGFNIFYQDVWVPGVSSAYQSFVSCINKTSIDATTCGTSLHNTATCPFSRCIHAFSIISQYYRTGNIANLAPNSNTRYGTCATFNSFMANFHTKYVQPVTDNIGNSVDDAADSTKLAGRFVINTKTPVEALRTQMNNNVDPLFNYVYGNLTVTHGLQSVFNIDTGVLKGLDCGAIGQSGRDMKQSLCITSFNKIFIAFVCVAIISMASFCQICCLVCFNVRHYMKQNQPQNNKLIQQKINRMHKMTKIHPLDDETNVDIKMMS